MAYVLINIDSGNGLVPDGTNYFLNQCWLVIKVQWHSSHGNFTRDVLAINYKIKLENYISTISYKSPGANEFNSEVSTEPSDGLAPLEANASTGGAN